MHSVRRSTGLGLWIALVFGSASFLVSRSATAQTAECGAPGSPVCHADEQALAQRLDQVMVALAAMQKQLQLSQQQIEALRAELKAAEARLAEAGSPANDEAVNALRESVQQLQEEHSIVQAEVKQHEQIKVETTSKYPLKVSGMLLFSAFSNIGVVDDIDQPAFALPRSSSYANGSLAATARQTAFGLEAFGPQRWGAQSSADISLDFFGGAAPTDYTPAAGLLRLRTMHAMLQWPHSSVQVEVDKPLIAPLAPTSPLSFAQPAMAWAGNLWVWSPQLAWSGAMSTSAGTFGLELGLIDPAAPAYASSTGQRQPNAAEQSRRPGYETRIHYALPFHDRSWEVGAGGFYSRQTYSYGQHVDAWAGTADLKLPISKWIEVSGALYRGRAMRGLGGAFQDYVVSDAKGQDDDGLSAVDAEGGWAQLKWRISRFVEANGAVGEANGFANELRNAYPDTIDLYGNLARNRTSLGNIIFRPSHYLFVSAEYRNLHSWPISGLAYTSQSVGMGAGYLF